MVHAHHGCSLTRASPLERKTAQVVRAAPRQGRPSRRQQWTGGFTGRPESVSRLAPKALWAWSILRAKSLRTFTGKHVHLSPSVSSMAEHSSQERKVPVQPRRGYLKRKSPPVVTRQRPNPLACKGNGGTVKLARRDRVRVEVVQRSGMQPLRESKPAEQRTTSGVARRTGWTRTVTAGMSWTRGQGHQPYSLEGPFTGSRSLSGPHGAMAQLVAQLLCKQKVRGSSPRSSTQGRRPPAGPKRHAPARVGASRSSSSVGRAQPCQG